MSRLSIIIPFFKDIPIAAFEETLASVLLHRTSDVEILVINAADYSDPWDTDLDGVRFISDRPSANPMEMLNQSLRQVQGEIVHILYPGTEVTEAWTDSVLGLFESTSVGIVIPSVYDRRKQRRIFSLGIRYGRSGTLRTIRRSLWDETPMKMIVPHVSAVFFRKTDLQRIGGFDQSFLPQIAYVDAALALAEANVQTVVDQNSRIFVRPNVLPAMQQFVWGNQIERLYFRWLGRYHSLDTVFDHFASFFVDFWRHFPRMKGVKLLMGRISGLFYGNGSNRFRPRNNSNGDSVRDSIENNESTDFVTEYHSALHHQDSDAKKSA